MNVTAPHLVLFYARSGWLLEQCAALAHTAAREGWSWRYIADEHPVGAVEEALRLVTEEPSAGQVCPAADLHFHDSPLRLQAVIAALRRLIEQALRSHPHGVLLLIEMTWAIRSPSGAVYLREYEAAVHALLRDYPVRLVCLYNQRALLDSQLLTGLHMHPFVHAPEGWHANPHFVPAEIFVQRDVRAQLRHWLGAISPALLDEGDTPAATPAPPVYNVDAPTLLIAATSLQGRWKIRCFGRLHMDRADGAPVDWHVPKGATRKIKTLFAYLLHRGKQGATLEELAELLWPETSDRRHSLNRLYHVVNCLRRALSPELESNRASPFVICQDQRYFLAVPEHTWVDYPMFQELCYRGERLARSGELEQALLCYQSAERLYTGDFLGDIPLEYAASRHEDWCWSRRYWFREMYLKVLSGIAALYRQRGQIADALAYADKALRVDACCELAIREKMLALHAAHRRDALDRQYRLYCQALHQFEMGRPNPNLVTLYETLRREMAA